LGYRETRHLLVGGVGEELPLHRDIAGALIHRQGDGKRRTGAVVVDDVIAEQHRRRPGDQVRGTDPGGHRRRRWVSSIDGSGGKLDRRGYLPDAIEGFFANGGKRVYVTRVAPTNAAPSMTTLHEPRPHVGLRRDQPAAERRAQLRVARRTARRARRGQHRVARWRDAG
jgi:hypothetical protein